MIICVEQYHKKHRKSENSSVVLISHIGKQESQLSLMTKRADSMLCYSRKLPPQQTNEAEINPSDDSGERDN